VGYGLFGSQSSYLKWKRNGFTYDLFQINPRFSVD
jgi:hypothetical protein